jgi:hypothetical protein
MVVNLPISLPRLPALKWSAVEGVREIPHLPLALLAVAPVVLPTAYVACVLYRCARRTTATARVEAPGSRRAKTIRRGKGKGKEEDGFEEADTVAIPPDVLAAASENYVIARERITSEPVPVERLGTQAGLLLSGLTKGEGEGEGERGVLEKYLTTTMRLFTYTPQAYIMKAMVSRVPNGAAHAHTYSTEYLNACKFVPGDRVCGVYVVRERVPVESGGERVILDLSPPEGWKGPVVTGALDCGFVLQQQEEEGENSGAVVRLVNETLMWRRLDERPSLLEGAVGRVLHTLMVRWMVARAVDAVTADGKVKAA